MRQGINVKGMIEIINNKDGSILFKKDNLIVDDGLDLIANRLISNSPNGITHCAVGDDATASATTQTSLINEQFRKAITTQSAVNNIITSETTFDTFEANFNWREVGLFNDATAGSMLNRVVVNFNKNSESVTVRFTITFNRV